MSAPPIEPVELPENDADSGYDEEQISTASVTSSILAYQEENGRTYHAYKAGKYVMPNDEGEQERMDLHYHGTRLTLDNKHWIAPIDDPRAIIDIGTGTGIWAMDVADDFPGSTVLGTDLSPIQPTLVPPNLEFVVQDLEEPWDMPQRFDLVHTRYMNGFSIRSWPMFYRHAFEACKPGGWVENQEFDFNFKSDDGTLKPNSAIIKWQNLWENAAVTVGMTARCNPYKMADDMRDAGFINVVTQEIKTPIGAWPKDKRLREAGVFNLVGLIDGISGLSLRVFTQILGWSVNELETLLMQVRAEWRRKSVHSYCPLFVVYGQKPAPSPENMSALQPSPSTVSGVVSQADSDHEAGLELPSTRTPSSSQEEAELHASPLHCEAVDKGWMLVPDPNTDAAGK